ncbi:MAG: HEAT repeat domain-containing protein [Planctomycetota bacterium]|jgi:HEAT repeat protein
MRSVALLLVLAWSVLGDDGRSTEDLLAALSDRHYQVRRKAVLAVEGRKEAELLDRIIEIAQSDPHPNIRGYAADVLGSFRDKRIFPILARMAQEEEYGPRSDAYVALGKLGDPRGRKLLLEGLQAGRGIRGYAAEGLGLLGDAEGFEPVARLLLQHADDPYVAELAPQALERIRKPDALVFLRKHFVALPSAARMSTARVLGRHPDEKTRTMMEGLLKSDDRSVRLPAIRVLSGLRDKKSTPALLAHLARRTEDRAPVVEALGKARDPRAAAPLIAELRVEKELLVKMRLIEALGRLGDKAAIEVLLPLIDDTTLLAQPKTISAIWDFPWNTRVHGAAAWAILTIRDGKEPFLLADLSSFRDGQPPARVTKDIAAIREWAEG